MSVEGGGCIEKASVGGVHAEVSSGTRADVIEGRSDPWRALGANTGGFSHAVVCGERMLLLELILILQSI